MRVILFLHDMGKCNLTINKITQKPLKKINEIKCFLMAESRSLGLKNIILTK